MSRVLRTTAHLAVDAPTKRDEGPIRCRPVRRPSDGTTDAIVQLATHCWFEGGIEGYDRGQHDALTETD